MASVRPFSALLPPRERAAEIASVPYDVVDSAEAAVLADGRPWSFLHIIRPEIDLQPGTDLYSDPVYAKAASNLEDLIRRAPYRQSGEGAMFVYRLVRNGRPQVGVVGACSVDEYDCGEIAVHERTRQDKEDDRTRHITEMRCQAEAIFLAYRARAEIDASVEAICATAPIYDFVAEDGVGHTIWRVPDADALALAFAEVPRLYVADGHHRAKSASRARATLSKANPDHRGDEAYNRVMAVVFPDDQLEILPYNRVVTDLSGRSAAAICEAIAEFAPLHPCQDPSPAERHSFRLFADETWYDFTLEPLSSSVIDSLDVSLLQDRILAPILGIEDPRRDKRVQFIGGIRGTDELERRARASSGVAFSLYPTSLAELFAVADAGAIMPPKSTWFEPKLRSGLFLHRI